MLEWTIRRAWRARRQQCLVGSNPTLSATRLNTGGEKEMTIALVKPEIEQEMKSIIVKEFGGIDDSPSDIEDSEDYGS